MIACTPPPIRILHVMGSMARAGIQMRTLELLRAMDRQRYRFEFCTFASWADDLEPEARSMGCEVHVLNRRELRFPRRFQDLLERRQIDVVHCHVHDFSGYFLRLAAECGVAVRVAHFRSAHPRPVSTPARKLGRRLLSGFMARYADDRVMHAWVDRYATDVLGISEWSLAASWGLDWRSDRRCRVVYDGIETGSFRVAADPDGVRAEFGVSYEGPLLIHVGRVSPVKNHLRLAAIFAEVLRQCPAARLLLVGRAMPDRASRQWEQQLHARIAELGIGRCVHFAGERSDVARLIKAADVLLLPSLSEGLGDVVLEACAAGTPTLASDLPSVREISRWLAGVHCLSLDEPDDRWAELIVELAGRRPLESQREAALEAFLRSPFTVERCATALGRLWHGVHVSAPPGGTDA